MKFNCRNRNVKLFISFCLILEISPFSKLIVFSRVKKLSGLPKFIEGKDFKVLDYEDSKRPTVTQFFSFYCPHCKSFEPIIKWLRNELPDNVLFQKIHVSFMGGSMGFSMSKAYATMVVLDIEERMTQVLFNRIHNTGKSPNNDGELRQIFLDAQAYSSSRSKFEFQKKFDAAFKSFMVDSKARRMDKRFENSGLTGVPAIIVNNKYLVKAEASDDQNSEVWILELVNYLLTQK